jgi:protein-S-isoprenylcysteine O-methyltransferase Ste14
MRTVFEGSQSPWAFYAIQMAWVVTFVYFFVSMLLTNRIKRRETGGARVLDRVLLLGGYFLLFAEIPQLGALNLHFMAETRAMQIAGAVITCAGLGLTNWSRARLGRYWSGVVALKQDHRLIQSGPYRVVRHPLYTGIIVAAIGMVLFETTWSSVVGMALLTACFERRAHKEDALLASEFGAEFEIYRQRTGRLVPRLSRAG